ncbi:MAG: hypothetical protein FJ405_01785 [Verrucomicrobia bacterium]|nr:hypothetical protein [Verrucomicrobiota bacterium]
MTSPAQWTPGGQNYVFLSLGGANTPGTYQHEVKTTLNSVSTLEISAGTPRAQIQVARIGRHLILLRRPEGGNWTVHRRYSRPDFPVTLQAGLTVYTDWANCERVGFVAQNLTVLTNGARLPNGSLFTGASPDLEAAFDYVRYARPRIPANLANADFSNPASVSDSQLLAFLGDQAHEPTEALRLDVRPESSGNLIRLAYPSGSPMESHRLSRISIHAATDLGLSLSQWRRITAPLVLTDGQAQAMDTGASSSNHFYIAVEMP